MLYWLFFKMFFILKYIKIIYIFILKKIIFNIKRFKNIKIIKKKTIWNVILKKSQSPQLTSGRVYGNQLSVFPSIPCSHLQTPQTCQQ
jgi:hypothetical protein